MSENIRDTTMTNAAQEEVGLRFSHVSFAYTPDKPLISDLSFELPARKFIGIIGPNGSGKSSLLKLATMLNKPTAGSIEVYGRNIAALSARERARLVSLLPQDVPAVSMDVHALALCGRYAFHGALYKTNEEDEAAVDEALASVDMTDRAHHIVSALSGGQRQRAYLAMALAQDAQLMLLDEPTSALDIKTSHEVLGLIRDNARSHDITACAAIHDLDLALRYCDLLMLMSKGAVVRIAPPNEMIESGDIERVFSVNVEQHEGAYGTSWSFFPRSNA